MRLALPVALAMIPGLWAFPGIAQQGNTAEPPVLNRGAVVSPVLTIESDKFFLQSAFGQRVLNEIAAQEEALASENRRIEAELAEEELALTEQRPTLAAEEFRALADAFDEKVQGIRRAQAEKSAELDAILERERDTFLNASAPVLGQIMRQFGAAVILEKRTVIFSASAIDITEEAIVLLDRTLGTGAAE